MSIASASKWVYSTYVVQRHAGVLSATDIKFLTFSSGYTNFADLPAVTQTVQECVDYQSNGVYTPANDGKFAYNGGHMQKHAALAGLGTARQCRARDRDPGPSRQRHRDSTYGQPQLAGGIATDADDYAALPAQDPARRAEDARQRSEPMPVCTNPPTCPTAVVTPSPPGERWHYSIGHWVEDDPDRR